MTYQLTAGDCIFRVSDGVFIPADPGNTDYRAYQEWVAAGNAAEPAPDHADP